MRPTLAAPAAGAAVAPIALPSPAPPPAAARGARLRRFVRRFVRHDPRGVALSAALMLSQGVLRGAGVLLLVPLLAVVGIGDAGGSVTRIAEAMAALGVPRSLPAVLALYVAVVAGRAALTRTQAVHNQRLQLGWVRSLRRDVFAALLSADWRFAAGARRAELTQTLTQDVQRAGQAAAVLLRGAVDAVVLGVYLAIALRLSAPMTAVAVGVSAAVMVALRGSLARARTAGRDQTTTANRLYAVVTEFLGGMREVKSYGAEARTLDAFQAASRGTDETRLRFTRQQSAASFWMTTGGVAALAAIVWVAVTVLALPTASLLLMLYLFAQMLPAATKLQSSALSVLNALPAFAHVERTVARARATAPPDGDAPAPPLERGVAFEGVSFAYGDAPTLDAVSFEIPAGRTTVLVGASGAGKSTAAMLLLGLLRPDAGRIAVDGAPLGADALRDWRRGIGYVPQETFLLHDTVAANLRLAAPDAPDADLERALRDAAAGFVLDLPDGLDTVVGDRGLRLSGGERQRVALARALVRRPRLLVLDEATSALDLDNERRVYGALEALHGRLTVVVITHRTDSLGAADHVVVLEDGRVAAAGTPAEVA